MRDRAVGEDVEVMLARGRGAVFTCRPAGLRGEEDRDAAMQAFERAMAEGRWAAMEAEIVNPRSEQVRFELALGPASDIAIRRSSVKPVIHRGEQVLRFDIPAGATRRLKWQMRNPNAAPPE